MAMKRRSSPFLGMPGNLGSSGNMIMQPWELWFSPPIT